MDLLEELRELRIQHEKLKKINDVLFRALEIYAKKFDMSGKILAAINQLKGTLEEKCPKCKGPYGKCSCD